MNSTSGCPDSTGAPMRGGRSLPAADAVDLRIDAARFDVTRAMLADLGDAEQAAIPVAIDAHHIGGLERQQARRQRKARPLARRPGFEQPRLGDRLGLRAVEHQRQIRLADAAAGAGDASRLGHRLAVIAARRNEAHLGRRRQLRLLPARQRQQRAVGARLDEIALFEGNHRRLDAAMAKQDGAAALQRIEEVGKLQRLQRVARRHDPIDDVARHRAVERAGLVLGKAVVGEQLRHRLGQRRVGEAARQPMAEAPVVAIAPHGGVGGKGRIRARIPAIDVDALHIDHAGPVDLGKRIGTGEIVA